MANAGLVQARPDQKCKEQQQDKIKRSINATLMQELFRIYLLAALHEKAAKRIIGLKVQTLVFASQAIGADAVNQELSTSKYIARWQLNSGNCHIWQA